MPLPKTLFQRDAFERCDYGDWNKESDHLDRRFKLFVKTEIDDEFPHALEVDFGTGCAGLPELFALGLLGDLQSSRVSVSPDPLRNPEERAADISMESYYKTKWGVAFVAESPHGGGQSATWYARKRPDIDEILETLSARNFFQKVADDDSVLITIWHRTSMGVDSVEQTLKRLPWDRAQHNYPSAARGALTKVVRATPDSINGKILLLTGDPGTGKSHFIQTLATEWRTWCRTSVLWSPPGFLADESYVFSLLDRMKTDFDEQGRSKDARWNLLVMEDSGELIETTGALSPGFSTLLNVSDGLLGLSLNLLFAITTNEPVAKIHKAIRRPGRLLGHVELGHMTTDEANAWLDTNGSPARVTRPSTLAELYGVLYGESLPGAETVTGFR